jgi:hypothetical protein
MTLVMTFSYLNSHLSYLNSHCFCAGTFAGILTIGDAKVGVPLGYLSKAIGPAITAVLQFYVMFILNKPVRRHRANPS